MPKIMKALGFIGMIAMLMVGGGILMHNLPFLHGFDHLGADLPSILPQIMALFTTPVIAAILTGAIIVIIKKLLIKK
jgi:predicted DNA repair protein MutK